MRPARAWVLALLALAGCESMTEKQPTFFGASSTSIFDEIQPGLSDLDTQTPQDKAEEKWWDKYYGASH